MHNLRNLRRALLLMLCVARPSVAQETDINKRVIDEFSFLKGLWPDVGAPQFVGGNAVEFRSGQIQLGDGALEKIPVDAKKNGAPPALEFIVAHEAWHSVQAKRYSAADLASLRSSRVLECEADFMGAYATANMLRNKGLDVGASQDARSELESFVQGTAQSMGDASYYLDPADRAKTISLGWHLAIKPELFKSLQPSKPEAVARQACEMLANVSDGSLGRITFSAYNEPSTQPNRRITLSLTNFSKKPIVAAYMLVETLWTPDGPKSPVISNIVVDERKLPPDSKDIVVSYPFTVAAQSDLTFVGFPELWTTMSAGAGGLVTTHYANDPMPAKTYCVDLLLKKAIGADKDVLTRLATLALSAADDFKAVRVEPGTDVASGLKSYKLSPTISRSTFDDVMVSSSGPFASLVVADSDSEQQVRNEYARLERFVIATCPGMTRERADKDGEPSLSIDDFAPKASASLITNIWRVGHVGSRPASPGGIVQFIIHKSLDDE